MTTPQDMTAHLVSEEDVHGTHVPELSEEALAGLIADITSSEAPRRFWLCQTTDLSADLVVGWGLAFDETAMLFRNGRCAYVSDSAERLHALLSRLPWWHGVRLVWVDAVARAA